MADPFLAEIRIFPFNFPPVGWARCDGQLLALSQNTALFSLLGTNYGGNGTTTFALPDLRGCAPMHPGQGVGLSQHDLGETGGAESVTLLQSELPAHNHPISASAAQATSGSPAGQKVAAGSGIDMYAGPAGAPHVELNPAVLEPVGSSGAHNNMMPYLTFYFCIALQGIYPPRP